MSKLNIWSFSFRNRGRAAGPKSAIDLHSTAACNNTIDSPHTHTRIPHTQRKKTPGSCTKQVQSHTDTNGRRLLTLTAGSGIQTIMNQTNKKGNEINSQKKTNKKIPLTGS